MTVFRLSLALLAVLAAGNNAQALLISEVFEFSANDNSAVSAVTQSVTVTYSGTQQISFDLDLTVSGSNGGGAATVFDTSTRNGLSLTSGGGLQVGDEISFSIGISNVNIDVDGDGNRLFVDASSLTFRSLSPNGSFGSASAGTVVTPSFTAGSSDWRDSNSAPTEFLGHFIGTRNYISNQFPGANFNVRPGFDLPLTNAANGGSSTIPITSFSHRTTGSFNPGYTLGQIVVQVRATPEPSSLLLGLLPVAAVGLHRRSRERIRQLLSQKVDA